MGVLDDAIKEHLDLKRKHGASEDELRKQEAEALGPGRREPVAEAHGEEVEAEIDGEEPALATGGEELATELLGDTAVPLGEPPLEDEPAGEIELEAIADLTAEPPREPEPPEALEPDEVPSEETLEAPRRTPAEPAGEEDAEEDEDVLEETPEFLQETPEHDRLWFEQKPPRDFDFDE